MRHDTQDPAGRITDACNVVQCPIGVPRDIEESVDVPEHDLAVLLERLDDVWWSDVSTVTVTNRDADDIASLKSSGEGCVGTFHAERDRAGDEMEMLVPDQGAGEQAGFTENLEPVADAEDRPTGTGVLLNRGHDRTEPRDGAAAEVVTVTESTWQNDDVDVRELGVSVPNRDSLSAGPDDGPVGFRLTVAAGVADDGDSNHQATTSMVKSSVTGFASKRSHIERALSVAASAELLSTTRSMARPR
jgi:hypothetical protein